MRTIIVRNFNELDPKVQEVVIRRVRDTDSDMLLDIEQNYYLHTLREFEKKTGIEFIKSFEVNYDTYDFRLANRTWFDDEYVMKPARLRAWLYHNLLQPLEQKKCYRIPSRTERFKDIKRYSKFQLATDYNVCSHNHSITGTYSDCALIDAIYDCVFTDKVHGKTVGGALAYIFNVFFADWCTTLDHVFSDDGIKEHIVNNEMWFTSKGIRVDSVGEEE